MYALGMYRIAAEHLFPGTSIEELDKYSFWYLELVQRTGQFLYKAYIGETQEELKSTTATAEITSDQLHRAEFLGSHKPISYYVAPAKVLPYYLGVQFSAAGLFYFHIAGPCEGEVQPVRIVATAERLSNPETRSAIVDFTNEELRQAVLLTPELLRLSTSDLRAIVEAYAESKVINHRLYANPVARAFAAVFEQAEAESLKELQALPAQGRASIQEDYTHFVLCDRATHTAEETALQSAIERGKLSLEKLEDLQRTMEESLFCLLGDRKPLEATNVGVEEEEIEAVFVPEQISKRVCEMAHEEICHAPLIWRRRLALRSALWALHRQLQKRNLQESAKKKLREQDSAIRIALVNEQSVGYKRVQILPVSASATRLKGYYVQLFRKAA